MAYRTTRYVRRGRRMRPMSGITSQPPGLPVASSALGTTAVEYPPILMSVVSAFKSAIGGKPPPTTPVPYPSVQGPAAQGGRRARAMSGMPDWYRQMQGLPGTSLGDDDQGTLTQPTIVEAGPTMTAWQNALIAQSQKTDQTIQRYMATETQQRWFQIAATLSIPLAAAIWRVIFGRGVE